MPTYRSITTSIISQHGIFSLPEYPPPAVPNDPFSTLPTLCDQERGLVSVYIPTYPSSQFWIRYSIAPPYPPRALYYFKLFLKGNCVLSWGCGEEDGYEGRTMFGLYDSGDCWMGETGVERRILCFGRGVKLGEDTAVDPDDVMEIRIYRAKGRMRIKPRVDSFQNAIGGAENMKGLAPNALGSVRQVMAFLQCVATTKTNDIQSLISAGLLTQRDPQRFYKYALLDPLDKPFATFHYYIRTWRECPLYPSFLNAPSYSGLTGQLGAMGLVPPAKDTKAVQPQVSVERPNSPVGSHQTASSNQTLSSSSSSSNTREHTIIPRPALSSNSPPKWAIFAPKFTRSPSTEFSPKRGGKDTQPEPKQRSYQRAITAPSLISLSPPHNRTVTQAKFASLVRRARTPSPTKGGIVSRIPIPSPRKQSSSRRTPTPSPPKRRATRIPTPSPSKQDRILGRSLTPSAEPISDTAHTVSGSQIPRSGSMNLLMTAVNSAINRRRRIMIDGTLEHPAQVVPCSLEKPTRMGVDSPEKSEGENPAEGLNDTSSGDTGTAADEIELFKALEESPEDHTHATIIAETPKRQETSEEAANEAFPDQAKAHGTRNVSDSSSTKRRRWGIWGGLKQNKATEQVSDATGADFEGPQGSSSTRLREGKAREPRLWEQL